MKERANKAEWDPWELPGVHIWKSHAEYSTRPVLIGTPYWQITRKEDWQLAEGEEKGLYYMWELDTESRKYHLRRASADCDELIKEGWDLDQRKGEERAAADPYRLR